MNISMRFAMSVIAGILFASFGSIERLSAQGLTAASPVLAFGKEFSVRASIPSAPGPALTLVTSTGGVTWDLPSTGSLYAAVGVPPGIPVGRLLTGANIRDYNAAAPASVFYEAPNHPYLIQAISGGGTVVVGGKMGTASVSITLEYGRERIAISTPNNAITKNVPTPVTFAVPAILAPLSQLRIDFGATVSVPALGGVGRVFTVSPRANPLIVLVRYPASYNSSSITIKAIATSGTFIAANAWSAEGGALQATGATLSGENGFDALDGPPGEIEGTTTGQAVPTTGLAFGKERSVRATMPFVSGPATALVQAPAGMVWDLPTTGNLYASTAVLPTIQVNQLLTGVNINTYNTAFPASVFYEAPNHPFIIQSISQGGTVNVGGRLAASPQRFDQSMSWGRDRIRIETATPDGKVALGAFTTVVITVPNTFSPLNALRVDFGASVSIQGVVAAVHTFQAPANPLTLAVFYPASYEGRSVSIKAVSTTGAFLVAGTNSADGSGLQANGATVSGIGSFVAEKSATAGAAGSMTIAKAANARIVRKDGQVIYTYTVTNTSATVPLTNIRVWDNQIGDIRTIPALAPGAAVAVVSPATALTSTTKNHATATGMDPLNEEVEAESNEVSVTVIDPHIKISVWADPLESKEGKQVIYHYDVTNDGDAPLQNIVVNDAPFGPVGTTGQLASWDAISFTLNVVHPAGSASKIRNVGRVRADVAADGGTVNAEDDEEVTLKKPDLFVKIEADKTKVRENTKVKYTITVKNPGGLDLNVQVNDDGFGPVIPVTLMQPGDEASDNTKDETLTQSKTHTVTAQGTDYWGDVITVTSSVTVDVVHPSLKVTVRANGSAMKAKVSKGDPVTFDYTVENTGDCDLTDVKFKVDGSTIADIPILKAGETQSLPSQTINFDQDGSQKVTAVGTDPTSQSVSAPADVVLIEVSEGLLDDLQKWIANGKQLINEIDEIIIKFNAAYDEFNNRLSNHTSKNTDPCMDARLRSLLETAKTLHNQLKTNLDKLNEILKNPLLIKVSKMDASDVFAGGNRLANSDNAVKNKLDKMNQAWQQAACGNTPEGKTNLVTINGKVRDKKGAGLSGASVDCNGIDLTTDANGGFTVVLPLNSGDEVKADASYKIPAGLTVTGGNSTKFQSGDKLALVVEIDTSPNRKVTLTGQVQDKNGKPLPNAQVSCLGVKTTTDADGNYSLIVTAEAGKSISISASVTAGKKQTATGGASVEFKGEDALAVPAIVIQGVELAQSFSVTGVVLDGSGAGLAGASISAKGLESATNESGGYTVGSFEGITGDKVTVKASIRDKAGKTHAKSATAEFKGEGDLHAPDIVFSELAKQVEITISGRVLDGKGTGIPNATVSAKGQSVSSDDNGEFKGLGPFTVNAGDEITVKASVVRTDKKTAGGSGAVSSQSSGDVYTTLFITDAVVATEFTVTGFVVDAAGSGIDGADVMAGTWAGRTQGGGQFTSGSMQADIGAKLSVKAVVKAADGKDYGGSKEIAYQGGSSVDAGVITVAGVVSVDTTQKPVSLSISPTDPTIQVGKTVAFSALAGYKNNVTGDATSLAKWSGGEGNSFTATDSGRFTMSAEFGGLSASTGITVKDVKIDAAIDSTKQKPEETGGEDLCDPNAINGLSQSLAVLNASLSNFYAGFQGNYDRFMKEINDQNSKPCENQMVAAAYAGCQSQLESYETAVAELTTVVTDLLIRSEICPDSPTKMDNTTQLVTRLSEIGQQKGDMKAMLEDMESQFARFGCDENEEEESGNETADNTGDANVRGDGGAGGTEIPGDGRDNNGDGRQDEGGTAQGGANVTIYMFDSGSAKDDVFGLEVSGQGNLGSTPAGGHRTYPLNLPPGSYTAFVTVISAPDNVGTFTITIAEGETVIASQSGEPGQGTRISVPFTVGKTAPVAKSAFPLHIDMNAIIQFEPGPGGK